MSPEKASLQPLRIAVIEDDPLVQASLKILLKGQSLVWHPHLEAFLRSSDADQSWDIVLIDLTYWGDPKGETSVSLLPELRARVKEAELVVQSGLSEIDVMRSCVQNGASRFILKHHLADEVPALIERTLETRELQQKLDQDMIGNSEAMRRLKHDLLSLRFEKNIDILIEGETGSGKELCAKALHSGGPFVAVNVSAIPAELFESEFFGAEKGAYTGSTQSRAGHFENAQSGTLFLDEIQSLAPVHQSKLLRVLETRRFCRVGSSFERRLDARVVSAANQNLREAVGKNQFREDLYYRIAPLTIHVPPLRVRSSDISLLARSFVQEFDNTKRMSLSDNGARFLEESYDWPGNVRELRNLIRATVLQSKIPIIDGPELQLALGVDLRKFENTLDVPTGAEFSADLKLSFDENIERLEKYLLTKALSQNKSGEAREKLGLARSRFYEKVKQYKLLKNP